MSCADTTTSSSPSCGSWPTRSASGSDILGALVMGHAYNSWWTGSDLSIEESRRLVPHQNATTMQVAIAVVAAVMWMLENPARGVCVPDDLPHDYVLDVARPYLGKFISDAVRLDAAEARLHELSSTGYVNRPIDPAIRGSSRIS